MTTHKAWDEYTDAEKNAAHDAELARIRLLFPAPEPATCITCNQPSDDINGWTQRCESCDENARFDGGFRG